MGKSFFIVLAVCIMFSGTHGESQSMSCSTVNGKTICNKETSSGNMAMASSSAFSGSQGSSQNTYAGAGNPGDWQSSGQRVVSGNGGPGNFAGGFAGAGPRNFAGGFAGGFAGAGAGNFAPRGFDPFAFAFGRR